QHGHLRTASLMASRPPATRGATGHYPERRAVNQLNEPANSANQLIVNCKQAAKTMRNRTADFVLWRRRSHRQSAKIRLRCDSPLPSSVAESQVCKLQCRPVAILGEKRGTS